MPCAFTYAEATPAKLCNPLPGIALSGRYYGQRGPILEMGQSVNGGRAGEWNAAVPAFFAARVA